MEPVAKRLKSDIEKPDLWKLVNGYLVPATCSSSVLPINKINAHPRDAMISFDEGPHIYYVKGQTGYTSVTTFLHRFFEEFDALSVATSMVQRSDFKKAARYAQYWKIESTSEEDLVAKIMQGWEENGKEQAGLGTLMHEYIELCANGLATGPSDEKERQYYHAYAERQAAVGMVPYRTEWMLWDEELKITGSIDMIYQHRSGTFHMVDWKRSKEIKKFGFKKGKLCCAHLQDCNFVHYSLQLNLYKYLLEKNYGIQIADMHIVVFHPSNDSFHEFKVSDHQPIILQMIQTIKE